MTEVIYGFFSYAHADAATDKALFDAFSEDLPLRVSNQFPTRIPVRLWLDLNLRTGDLWDPKIEANLRDSKFLVVMLSPQWLASDYCRKEFEIFCEEETKRGATELIVPILVRDVESKKADLTDEQRAVYDKLSARQYKSARVTQFYKLTSDERIVELEKLAEEIYPRIKPFLKKPEPLPAPVSVSSAPPPPASLPPHNLPLKSLGRLFMGRDVFMADLETRLKGDGAAAVTEGVLQGMGGVGKTRLAIEYAWRHAKDYAALLFVSAETPETLATGLAALAATLNLPEQELPQDPVKREAVLRWFAQHDRWLLILDNVDDEKAAAAVADLLPTLTNGVTLITARYDGFPANIETMPLGVLAPEPARDFLLARTKARRRVAADDDARAAELAKELGYLALALEQAGAFIAAQRISFERYLAYWRDERARVVDWFDKTAMGTNHNEGLAAVFATSVARLSPDGLRLLNRMAFLSSEPIPELLLDHKTAHTKKRFLFPLLEWFWNRYESNAHCDMRIALGELFLYSLASPAEIEGKYSQPAFLIHRLVQEYCRIQESNKEFDSTIQTFLEIMNENDPYDVRCWCTLTAIAPHTLSVIEHAKKENMKKYAAYLNTKIGQLLQTQGRYEESEIIYRESLDLNLQIFEPTHDTIVRCLNNIGHVLHDMKRYEEAEPFMRKALEIDEKRHGEYSPEITANLNNLAQLLMQTSRIEESEQLMRRALSIDEGNNPYSGHFAIRLDNFATFLAQREKFLESEHYIKRALKIGGQFYGKNHPEMAVIIQNYALLLSNTRRPIEADANFRQAVKILSDYYGISHPQTKMAAQNYFTFLTIYGFQNPELRVNSALLSRRD